MVMLVAKMEKKNLERYASANRPPVPARMIKRMQETMSEMSKAKVSRM